MFQTKKYEPIRESLAVHERKMNRLLLMMCTVITIVEVVYIIELLSGSYYTPADGLYYYQIFVLIGSCAMFFALGVLTLILKERYPKFPRRLYLVVALIKAVSYSIFTETNGLIYYLIPGVFAIGYFDVLYSFAVSVCAAAAYPVAEILATYFGIVDLNFCWIESANGVDIVYNIESYIRTRLVYGVLPASVWVITLCAITFVLTKIGADTFLRENSINREKAALDTELSLGRDIQQSMLPDRIHHEEYFSAYSYLVSAKEVGGDFIDYFPIDENRVLFTIGDVSGKGISASLFASNAKALIRAFAMSGLSARDIITQVNSTLYATNKKMMFVTIWLGILDLTTGEVTSCNAGHNAPILKTVNGEASYIRMEPNFIVGCDDEIEFVQESFMLQPGDSVVLYTDGVTEARDEQGEFYGEQRLIDFAAANVINDRFTKELRKSIFAFKGSAEQSDDISIASVTYTKSKS